MKLKKKNHKRIKLFKFHRIVYIVVVYNTVYNDATLPKIMAGQKRKGLLRSQKEGISRFSFVVRRLEHKYKRYRTCLQRGEKT